MASQAFIDLGEYRLCLMTAGQEPPLVILEAGAGDASTSWQGIFQAVAHFTQVLAYDRAGLGQSDAVPRPRTACQLTDDLIFIIASWRPRSTDGYARPMARTRFIASLRPFFQCHRQSVPRRYHPQPDMRLDTVIGNQAQAKALYDRRQHQLRLHHGEGVADALAWAAAKGEVSESRAAR